MRAAVLSLLVLALPTAAQIKGPTEVTVAVGRLAAVPLTVDGDESDYAVLGSDVDAFREYTTDPKQIRLRVIGYAPGTAYVSVAAVKGGHLQPLFVVKITITGTPVPPGPVPPGPVPPGPTPPDPPTPPAPIPAAGLRVLMVYESADLPKMPRAQSAILFSKSVRDTLDARCVVGPDGKTKEWRIWDKDTNGADDSPLWDAAMKRPRAATPWLVISNGKTGYEGPLPADAGAFITLLDKYK